ncbi:hypothetical protein [Fundidesulfovibrio agrisoli]|uniref:hypothetical protein n=1 Tax=Fundidesulfovibrio agrisoli TaxID=2922717 RepID=UPI001FAE2B29|nr:hypothetical protein [Fundidesulfovibrio agrisoli]
MPAIKGQKIEAKYDAEKLYALIKDGKTMKEIMVALDVKSVPTFNNHLLRLMTEKKEFLEIAGATTRTRSSVILPFLGCLKSRAMQPFSVSASE